MTWSTLSDSSGYKFTYDETTGGGTTITYIDTYNNSYELTATSWSDTSGNSSSISWSVSDKTFDFDGDKSTNATTQTVLVESGTTTWNFVDDTGANQKLTRTFEPWKSPKRHPIHLYQN